MAYGFKRRTKRGFASTRKYTRRRTYTRPKRTYSRRKYSSTTLSRPLAPPFRTTMLTMYESGLSLNPATAGTATYYYCGNDIYDPNRVATGKQPYNFDEWMSLYGRFTVLWSQIEVWATTTDSNRQFTVAVVPSLATTVSSTTDTIQEMPGVKWAIFGGYQMSKTIGYVKCSRKVKTVLGVKDVLDDQEYSGSAAGSPSADHSFYYVIQVQSNDDSFDPSALTLAVRMKFIVRFQQRSNKNAS